MSEKASCVIDHWYANGTECGGRNRRTPREHELYLTPPVLDEVTRLEDNDVLEFTAEVDVKPTIELPTYDGLEASVEDIEISDEDVEEQVPALRQRFGPLTDITGCLVQRRLLAPVEPHLRPMRDQLARNLEPESPCRSGHQRRAPFE